MCLLIVFISIIALKQSKLWQGGLFQLQATEGPFLKTLSSDTEVG